MKSNKLMIVLAAVATVALCFITGCATSSSGGSSGGSSYSSSSSSYQGVNVGDDPKRIAMWELSEKMLNASSKAEAESASKAFHAKYRLPPPE